MTAIPQSPAPPPFLRTPLPPCLCNLDRLLHAMTARDLDGIVASLPYNVFYLTSFNGVAHKADEPRPYAVVLSRAGARAPGPGDRRLLSRDLPQAAHLGPGHPAVSGGDDAARSAAGPRRHRPLHPEQRRGHRLARPRPRKLRLRHGQRRAQGAFRPQARARPRRLRRHGLRLSPGPRERSRWSTATTR